MVYFEDADTLEVVLRDDELEPAAETVDGPKENITMDFDAEGRLVGLTIKEASAKTPFEALRETSHFEKAQASPAKQRVAK